MKTDSELKPSSETVIHRVACAECKTEFDREFCAFEGRIFPSMALQLPHYCPKCQPAADERARVKEAAREAGEAAIRLAEKQAQWATVCPLTYRLMNERGGLTDLKKLAMAQPAWRNVLEWHLGTKGLLLIGPTGTGKTRSVWRLLHREFMAGQTFQAYSTARFDRDCRRAGGDFLLDSWFEELARTDIFFLDDLGKAAWTDATEAQWFDLVEQRTSWGLPIIITTNDTGESIEARMRVQTRAAPLVRRLREYCDVIVFKKP